MKRAEAQWSTVQKTETFILGFIEFILCMLLDVSFHGESFQFLLLILTSLSTPLFATVWLTTLQFVSREQRSRRRNAQINSLLTGGTNSPWTQTHPTLGHLAQKETDLSYDRGTIYNSCRF